MSAYSEKIINNLQPQRKYLEDLKIKIKERSYPVEVIEIFHNIRSYLFEIIDSMDYIASFGLQLQESQIGFCEREEIDMEDKKEDISSDVQILANKIQKTFFLARKEIRKLQNYDMQQDYELHESDSAEALEANDDNDEPYEIDDNKVYESKDEGSIVYHSNSNEIYELSEDLLDILCDLQTVYRSDINGDQINPEKLNNIPVALLYKPKIAVQDNQKKIVAQGLAEFTGLDSYIDSYRFFGSKEQTEIDEIEINHEIFIDLSKSLLESGIIDELYQEIITNRNNFFLSRLTKAINQITESINPLLTNEEIKNAVTNQSDRTRFDSIVSKVIRAIFNNKVKNTDVVNLVLILNALRLKTQYEDSDEIPNKDLSFRLTKLEKLNAKIAEALDRNIDLDSGIEKITRSQANENTEMRVDIAALVQGLRDLKAKQDIVSYKSLFRSYKQLLNKYRYIVIALGKDCISPKILLKIFSEGKTDELKALIAKISELGQERSSTTQKAMELSYTLAKSFLESKKDTVEKVN